MDTYGNTGNEGRRGRDDENGDVDTYGNIGNQPSRHRDDIDIFVNPGNGNTVSMKANLNWTLDELHRGSAERCRMNPSQCHSSCAGVPVSGSSKVRGTSIRDGSTVFLSVRLRGG